MRRVPCTNWDIDEETLGEKLNDAVCGAKAVYDAISAMISKDHASIHVVVCQWPEEYPISFFYTPYIACTNFASPQQFIYQFAHEYSHKLFGNSESSWFDELIACTLALLCVDHFEKRFDIRYEYVSKARDNCTFDAAQKLLSENRKTYEQYPCAVYNKVHAAFNLNDCLFDYPEIWERLRDVYEILSQQRNKLEHPSISPEFIKIQSRVLGYNKTFEMLNQLF